MKLKYVCLVFRLKKKENKIVFEQAGVGHPTTAK